MMCDSDQLLIPMLCVGMRTERSGISLIGSIALNSGMRSHTGAEREKITRITDTQSLIAVLLLC